MNKERRPSITTYYKRKTKDTSFEENPFEKSKKTSRSPIRQLKDSEEVNSIKEITRESEKTEKAKKMAEIEQVMNMIQKVMEELKNIRIENAEWKKEIAEMRKEHKIREEKWQEEKNLLQNKMETLERKMEIKEKQEKKNNIIIKGLKINQGDKKTELKNFLKDELDIDVKPKEVRTIGKEKKNLLVILNTWEEKQEIMKNKQRLRNKKETEKVYVDNDLTENEIKIQKKITEIANKFKEEGKITRVRYQKIEVDGKWWCWDKERKTLLETKN